MHGPINISVKEVFTKFSKKLGTTSNFYAPGTRDKICNEDPPTKKRAAAQLGPLSSAGGLVPGLCATLEPKKWCKILVTQVMQVYVKRFVCFRSNDSVRISKRTAPNREGDL